jgi:lipopolysaccharide transport system permease protein
MVKAASPTDTPEIVLEARPGWRSVDLAELHRYRDLLAYMTLRGIKARFAQSALGIGWAVAQPVMTMLIFTVIFGRVARISFGGLPYALAAFCGIVPWTFFSSGLTSAATSLTQNAEMLKKIYFPRLILPLSAVAARFVDLGISLVLLAGMVAWYRIWPRPEALFLIPISIGIALLAALGLGLWLGAMAIQYRDVAYGLTFLSQMIMYVSPVIYPVSLIPNRFLPIYGLNPIAGVIAGFRAVLESGPIPWRLIIEGGIVAIVLFVFGIYYFRKSERVFADVV